jgi:restriction endonuclease S subunit
MSLLANNVGMIKKLGDIATIRSGYTFRAALHKLPQGNVQVFQARDVLSDEISQLPGIRFSNASHLLQNGDVLLSIRGAFRARAICPHSQVVAASSVLVIRLTDQTIVPEYLALYLNSSRGQDQLKSVAMGATIKTITRSELYKLTIPIPPPKTQRILSSLKENIKRQIQLASRQQELANVILSGAIKSAIKEQQHD